MFTKARIQSDGRFGSQTKIINTFQLRWIKYLCGKLNIKKQLLNTPNAIESSWKRTFVRFVSNLDLHDQC